MTDWDQEKQELLDYYEKLRGQAVVLERELSLLLNSFENDTALWRARKALEVIVYELCEHVLNRRFGTKDTLEGVIHQFKDKIPEPVCNAMHTLRGLGNRGTHFRGLGNRGTHSKPEPVTVREVRQAFLALASVLDWYVVEYKKIIGHSEAVADITPALAGLNPYRGLDAFEEKDADRFFGREHFLEERLWPAFEALAKAPPRLLALVGPSGSGKSSLARAGLLPLLKQKFPSCRLLVTTPTRCPLEALSRALTEQYAKPDDQLPTSKGDEILERLQRDDQGLRRVADDLYHLDSAPRVLLVDQFEEVFTPSEKGKTNERQRYLANLLNAISDPDPHLYLLLTLRSDFLAESQSYPAFNQALGDHAHLVPVLNDDGLKRAIAEPAWRAGRPLEDSVVQLLVEQSEGREGALPLLQHALSEIWQGLQQGKTAAATLHTIGGVGGALAGRAQAIYQKLPENEQTIVQRAFLKLVQLGKGEPDTRRRRVPLEDLVAQGEDRAAVRSILHRFADRNARFLTFGQEATGRESVEITHDALIRHWNELREWLSAYREDHPLLDRLEAAAKHWKVAGYASGLLWRRPDLDLLRALATRRHADFTKVQKDFYDASVADYDASVAEEHRTAKIKRITRRALGVITLLALLATLIASFKWWEADQQRIQAEANLQEAQYQKTQAEANFKRAREAVDNLIYVSESTLFDRLGFEPLRLKLLENARDYYQDMTAQRPEDREMQVELANTTWRLGNIQRSLKKDSQSAEAAYHQAIANFEALAREYPKEPDYQDNLASSHADLGQLLGDNNDTAGMGAEYQQAFNLWEQLVQTYPDVPVYQNKLSQGYIKLGDRLRAGGDTTGAEAAYQKALNLIERLVQKKYPEASEYQQQLAWKYRELGDDLKDRGTSGAAVARDAYQKVVGLRERLVQEHPDVLSYQNNLAIDYNRLGGVLKSDDAAEARTLYQKALDLLEPLAREHPEGYQHNLAMAAYHNFVAQSEIKDDMEGAWATYQKTEELLKQLTQEHPEAPDFPNLLVSTQQQFGILLSARGDPAGARDVYQKAIGFWESLVQAHPGVSVYQATLATSYNSLSNLLKDNKDLAGARDVYQKAIGFWESLVQAHPEMPTYQATLATNYNNHSNLLKDNKDAAGAQDVYQKAIDLWEPLVQAHPETPAYQNILANSYNNLTILLKENKNAAGAKKMYQKAIDLWEPLVQAHPEVLAYRHILALSYNNLGVLFANYDGAAGARKAYENAINLCEQVVDAHSTMPAYRNNLAIYYFNLGHLLGNGGNVAGARAEYQKAFDLWEHLLRDHPDVPAYRNSLAMSHNDLGNLLSTGGDAAGAREMFLKASGSFAHLAREFPDQTDYRAKWATVEGNLAWVELRSQNPQQAIAVALRGLEADPNQVWIRANLAHGYLLDNQYEKALTIYTENKDVKPPNGKTFAETVLADFKEFRVKGIDHPDMAKIEQLLRGAGAGD